MKLAFVKSNLIGSRLIRWALRSTCSHFVVVFDEWAAGSGIVFESSARGAQLSWFQHFKKTHTIVHALDFGEEMPLQMEELIYLGMLSKYSGQGYDYKALAFWVWRGFLWRVFDISLPPKNKWAVDGFNLCTGLAGGVPAIHNWAVEHGIDLEMIGPELLYRKLLDSGYFKDAGEWCATS